MSDGGRNRALLGAEVWKSFQKGSVQRSAVRSIAWLDLLVACALIAGKALAEVKAIQRKGKTHVQNGRW
jgi:hypothetical protein